MNMTSILISILALVISGMSLGWNIYIYLNHGPKLKLFSNTNFEVKFRENSPSEKSEHIEIIGANVGNMDTLVTGVGIIAYSSIFHYWAGYGGQNTGVSIYENNLLGSVVKPGHGWRVLIIQTKETTEALSEGKYVVARITHTFSTKPVYVRVKTKANLYPLM